MDLNLDSGIASSPMPWDLEMPLIQRNWPTPPSSPWSTSSITELSREEFLLNTALSGLNNINQGTGIYTRDSGSINLSGYVTLPSLTSMASIQTSNQQNNSSGGLPTARRRVISMSPVQLAPLRRNLFAAAPRSWYNLPNQ